MKFRVVKNHTKGHENIIKDQVIALQGKHKGMMLRRVESWVEVDVDWRAGKWGLSQEEKNRLRPQVRIGLNSGVRSKGKISLYSGKKIQEAV